MRRAALVLLLLAPAARAEEAGTLDRLADEVAGRAAAALGRVEQAGAADLALSVRARDDAGRLPALLERLLLARLRARGGVHSVTLLAEGGAERAAWGGFEVWLDVEVGLDGSWLVVTDRLVDTENNPWRRRGGEPVVASGHARVRLDAELRAHLADKAAPVKPPPTSPPPAPGGKKKNAYQLTRVPFEPPDAVLALAAGDVDADGAVELVALLPHEIVVYALRRDTLVEEQRFALEGPAPVGRARAPLGTLVVADVEGDPTPEILAQSSEHAPGVKLARGQKVGVTAAYPILGAVGASLVPGLRQLGKVQVAVTPAPALPDRMIALDGAVTRAGPLLASVDLDGTLRVWKLGQKNHWVQLAGAGSALEIADLDDDGKVELISSAARPAGFGDQLLIRSLRDDGTAKVAYRETTRGGIAAIGAGDLDGDGAVDVAVFVRELGQKKGELWLVR